MASDSIKPEDLEGMGWDQEESWEDELLLEEEEAGISGAGIDGLLDFEEEFDEWEEFIDSHFSKIMFEE